jgi:pimeloyl-ACP methyl ester carboxylesterase
MTLVLRHARVELALHPLQAGSGAPLLLLHALAGSAADWQLSELAWSGPVYALDLSGHGLSGRLQGGVYVPERWVADADCALRALGDDAWLVASGVSAYVALMLAGARPEAVRGALLWPGSGLDGAGAEPDFSQPFLPPRASGEGGALRATPATDPTVYFSERVVRPVVRARDCGEQAGRLVLCEDHGLPPPWWSVLRDLPNVCVRDASSLSDALLALTENTRPSARPQRSA